MISINEYIEENIDKCIRFSPKDKDTLIGLPYPYTVPCASDNFQEMYYWDTYFLNKGLIARGNITQAKNNANNMFYLIEKYGFVLNGNRTCFLRNSQPPLLSCMVLDIYESEKDKEWLDIAYKSLEKEYKFWMEKRMTDTGLNRYFVMDIDPDSAKHTADYFSDRIGFRPKGTDLEIAQSTLSCGESGWDMTPRTTYKACDYISPDLNSILFAFENNMAYFALELENEKDSVIWKNRAQKRADLCRMYLLSDDGIFYDYNFKEKCLSQLKSVASFYPLYFGLATEEEAKNALKLLSVLEADYGVITCEKNNVEGNYQWDYPNGWAPLQMITVFGLLNYGYKKEALRIAQKYISLVEKCYCETGNMWEKYNVVEGNINVGSEYGTPPMIGWSFGVYKVFCDLVNKS